MNFRLVVAQTREEKEQAFRLRYDAFFTEEGDSRYADHSKQLWSDCDDESGAIVLNAVAEDDRLAGTLRLTARKQLAYIAHECYSLELLVEILGIPLELILPKIARVDRGVVQKDFRRLGVFDALLKGVESIVVGLNCNLLVTNPRLANVPSILGLEKRGFQKYAVRTYRDVTAQLLFKQL